MKESNEIRRYNGKKKRGNTKTGRILRMRDY
jgi:hypothetical protein